MKKPAKMVTKIHFPLLAFLGLSFDMKCMIPHSLVFP